MKSPSTRVLAPALSLLLVAGLTACAAPGSDPGATDDPARPLVLVTYDSFALGEGVLEAFTEQTGVPVEVHALGDAGELVNKLVLTKDSPLGDVVFGIDNTFASRAVDAGVLVDYVSGELHAEAKRHLLPAGSGREQLTPIDTGDVCFNVDHRWFQDTGLAEPASLDDLLDERYRDLIVLPAPNSSSPGLAFLFATIAAKGEPGWQDYWRALLDNGAKLTGGWSDAYYSDFSGPSSGGDRPLVLSYATSPPAEASDDDASAPTGVLLDTCFRQVEYAGIIDGSGEVERSKQLVDFLYGVTVQEDIPGSMYMFPVNPEAQLPPTWERFAETAENPWSLAPDAIEANRDRWLSEWLELIS